MYTAMAFKWENRFGRSKRIFLVLYRMWWLCDDVKTVRISTKIAEVHR